MAKFGIQRTQRGLPGTSGSVRATFDPTTNAGAVGQAVGEFGVALGSKIKQRMAEREAQEDRAIKVRAALVEKNRRNQDIVETKRGKNALKDASTDAQFIRDNNPPDQQAELLAKRASELSSIGKSLDLSPQASQLFNLDMEAWTKAEEDKTLGQATERWQNAAIESSTESLTALAREGDVKAADVKEQWDILRFNGKTAGEIKLISEAAFEAGKKLRNEDAVVKIGNEAVSDPVTTLGRSLREQELRKSGDGEIPVEELSDKDLVSAERVAENRITELERNAKEDVNNAETQEVEKVFEGLADGSMGIGDIVNNKLISVPKRRQLIDDENQFIKKDLEQSWPLVDEDEFVQALGSMLTSQSSGQIDTVEMYSAINEAAATGMLTKDTRDSMRTKAKNGGNDAIDRSTQQFTARVKNALTGRFTDRVARAKVREASVGLEGLSRSEKNEIQTANFLLSVSFDQLHRYTADLDSALREVKGGRDTVSGTEATAIAASVWEKYKTKTTSQKINEFKAFTGARIPQPTGFTDRVWSELSPIDRSDVVALMERGLTANEAEDMVTK